MVDGHRSLILAQQNALNLKRFSMMTYRVKVAGPELSQDGFTLVEMVTVVAIVGILSAIALPSYRDYVVRGKLPDATSNLAAKRVQMEQYFQDNRTYEDAAPAVARGCVFDTATSQYFDFGCSVQNRTQFTIDAIGKGDMTGFRYTIDQGGAKQTVAVPAGWSLPTGNANDNCWVTKKGGIC
jgi:type IV pilus assembly protein PilE